MVKAARLLVAGLLVVGVIGLAWSWTRPDVVYLPQPPIATTPDPTNVVFSAPSLGIAFEYPQTWRLESDRRDQGGSSFLDLKFSTGATTDSGVREVGEALIRRNVDTKDTRLERWVRDNLRDTRRLLVFSACSFPSRALECIEITDQSAWIAAGRTRAEFTVYLKTPGHVYSVAWSESDTFDYRGTGGRVLLQSLRFGER